MYKPYTQVPIRLQIPIETVLDDQRAMLSCVLLGFTRDGDHLISYTSTPVAAADNLEGYHLQVWRFSMTDRIERLSNIPLFQAGSAGRPDEHAELFGDTADAKRVTVCETADSQFLIVHGRSAEAVPDGQEAVNHLTIIPLQLAGCTSMEVAHYQYMTAEGTATLLDLEVLPIASPRHPSKPYSAGVPDPPQAAQRSPMATDLPALAQMRAAQLRRRLWLHHHRVLHVVCANVKPYMFIC
ncbi:hypothetical protein WJX72_001301 [[Myrmecia] bisecta]|uniref:DDB1- and CUL4-associated factor 15 WD40 repeat-containing domain-containing protein n=1 Tax=[Myrmecia] bisecta TaxID=41462 RepID=A0AAW1P3M9_9CHLO